MLRSSYPQGNSQIVGITCQIGYICSIHDFAHAVVEINALNNGRKLI